MTINIRVLSLLTLAVCSASISAQTSVFPPINESSFARYSTWECARSETWSENQFWRDKRPDTTYFARTGNLKQRSAVATASRCVNRFNTAAVAQRDLLGLIQSHLAAEQETQADAATAKLLASAASSAQAKAWALYQAVDLYLGASQPKIAKAERYITQLNAMGAQAAVERMLAHKALADVARFRDSIPLWDKELNAALAASKQMTGDTRKEYAYESASVYLALADLSARNNNPKNAISLIETARTELVPLRASIGRFLQGVERHYTMMGTPASPVQATKWFNTNGNNVHPISGKPALLVFAAHSCGDMCYSGYAVLRRLRAKFEARGLDITIITRTSGFYRNQLVKPDAEITAIDNYFTNHLQLPVNLAVWQADFGRRDDGKLTVLSAPNDEALRPDDLLDSYIIAPDGTIRLVSSLSRRNEAILEDVIASLL